MSIKSLANWAKQNPARRKEQQATLYAIQKKRKVLWRHRKPEAHREILQRGRLRRNFGLTLEQYDAMAAAQNFCCAICGKKKGWRALAVDHNHETNQVRALLCHTCNTHLGVYEKHRRKFEEYLDRFRRTL